ncbi:hypothetical protein BpHYR1_004822 [Brachionus plicatilis]|uniref:Uncharacterized protein n=1 Tax=Brachionus plicatilis TaxID=10195 RepID=A0A3M7SFD2_BRAPC|nr:hypothetical protein BpHYR1_004822 [Brachionus plicatilis]
MFVWEAGSFPDIFIIYFYDRFDFFNSTYIQFQEIVNAFDLDWTVKNKSNVDICFSSLNWKPIALLIYFFTSFACRHVMSNNVYFFVFKIFGQINILLFHLNALKQDTTDSTVLVTLIRPHLKSYEVTTWVQRTYDIKY